MVIGTLYITKILCYTVAETKTPFIKTDLNDETPYAATAGTAMELSIVAEDASSYAWYTCTSPTDYDAGKTLLTGQTTSTCSYTPTEAGTTYVYCVVSNGTGDDIKTAYSKIATVVAAPGGDTKTVTYMWDVADWKDGVTHAFVTTNAAGESQYFPAKDKDGNFDDSQKMYYYGGKAKNSTWSSSTQGFDDFKGTRCVKTGGASVPTSGEEDMLFKYHAPFKGKITVYAKSGGNASRYLYVNNSTSTAGAAPGDGTSQAVVKLEYNLKEDDSDIYIWATNNFYIYGIKADLEEPTGGCAKPKEVRGAWSGDSTQKWTYTVSSTTETAHIHYKINGGDEQVEEDNSVNLVLSPGDKVKAWAVDSTGEEDNSVNLEFTADPAAQADKPTITVGNYSITNKGFEVTLAVEDGSAIHYTTDGTEPTESSATYSSAIYAEPGATVKAIAVKAYYGPSDVASTAIPDFTLPEGSEKILGKNGSASRANNIGVTYTVNGDYNAGAMGGDDKGIKFRSTTYDAVLLGG